MRFTSDFLNLYLALVEDTESPRIMHVMSALTGVSACLGRRCYLPMSTGNIYANQFTVLVGPPAVRKSTAIIIASRIVKSYTNVRFAPHDTGGQRQGLLASMQDAKSEEEAKLFSEAMLATDASLESIMNNVKMDLRDTHTMFAASTEWGSLMGQRNTDLLTFMIKLWDGEDYEYKIKSSNMVLKDPLLTMLAATTTTDIADILPQAAFGKGFMSRLILVFADSKYKSVPRPPTFDEEAERAIGEHYGKIFNDLNSPFTETPAAAALFDELYTYHPDIKDNRFVYYEQRRNTAHLKKLAMCLAASRLSLTITPEDIEEAHYLLAFIETSMPNALGEFGLSPTAAAKQKMLEFLVQAGEPISEGTLWAVMHRDLKSQMDFQIAIADLINAGKLRKVKTNKGEAIVAVTKKAEDLFALAKHLEEEQ